MERNEIDKLAEETAGKLRAAIVRAEVREEQARLIMDAIDRLDWSQESETYGESEPEDTLEDPNMIAGVQYDEDGYESEGGCPNCGWEDYDPTVHEPCLLA